MCGVPYSWSAPRIPRSFLSPRLRLPHNSRFPVCGILYRESVIALDCVQAADPSSSAPTPEDPVDAVFSLFTRFGNSDYIGEPVSSEEHALQVGR